MGAPKPIYAAVPARVIGAENLTALDLRVLMVIAIHDRLGANGIGCYANHRRLAELVGCHVKSLSRSMNTLAAFGYVTANPHPLNRRLRVYRVTYSDFDADFLRSIGNKAATYEAATGNGLVPVSASIGNQLVPETSPKGNRDSENTEQDQWDAGVNILGETLIHPGEPVSIYPVETASPMQRSKKGASEGAPSKSVGALLAMVERSMKAGMSRENAMRWFDWLEGLVERELTNDDADYGRAERLYHKLAEMLDAT